MVDGFSALAASFFLSPQHRLRKRVNSIGSARAAPGQAHRPATQAQPGPVARPRARAPARARGVRLRQRAVDREPGARCHRVPDRGAVPRGPRLAHSAQAQLELPASQRQSARARRAGDPAVEESHLAADLKKARCERRTLVFVDESGVNERPQRVRTWAPRGQTPVLQHHFNWKVLSAAAGITWWNFYFRLYPGAIHAAEVIDFLGHLLRHLPGKLLVVWDGLPQHRARLVAEFIRAQRGRLAIERLPAYAPELNPVEYIWGYWKHHELPNFCPRDFGQLSYQARRALLRMRHRPPLMRSIVCAMPLFNTLSIAVQSIITLCGVMRRTQDCDEPS